ncbi:MAG TPA: alpha/beta hydrolase [Actinomycetota bacterium]|jgi:pimeloyl-ACP methyl ester carboxylesterase
MDVGSELSHLREAAAVAGVDIDEVVAPDHGDVVVGGMRLHYVDWGSPGRAPVLFLHGGALTARTWDLVCLALRRDFRCLALDQRGHGDSEWSPSLDYSLEAHVGDVHGFIEALGLAPVALVGHSLGAFVGIALAARHPELVSALVLVDAGPGVRSKVVKEVTEFILGPAELDSLEDFVARARAFNPRRNERLLRRSLLHNLRPGPDGRWTWKYDRRHLSPETFEAMRRRFNQLEAELGSITCPTLVVRGGESAFSDEDVERVTRQIPEATWARIDNAGHTVQGDNPRDLSAALHAFLRARLNATKS